MDMTFFFLLIICAVCFYFLGYRIAMRDKDIEIESATARSNSERNYWCNVAARLKKEMATLGEIPPKLDPIKEQADKFKHSEYGTMSRP